MDGAMEYKEIEYKYWARDYSKEDFQLKLESVCDNIIKSMYVVSCDDYYLSSSDKGQGFVRFRKGGGRYELTLKRKEQDNVVRSEINLNVSSNDDSSIVEFLRLSGYEKDFQVYKEAWIWYTEDCVLSYYTLSDGRSVIEIESENYKTVEEGIDIINRWESLMGLDALQKEPRSLYEVFTEERSLDNDEG